mgnify:CR=1 FL=1
MIVKKITKSLAPKLVDGTLPDIDSDFAGVDRGAVKGYMEEGSKRTFVKGVLKEEPRHLLYDAYNIRPKENGRDSRMCYDSNS